MPVAPKILIAGLEAWPGVARLPHALQVAGFEVGVVCREDSCLAATRFRDRLFTWRPGCRRGGALLQQLKAIVDEWRPDFLVPGDDPTVVFLARAFARLNPAERLASLLKFSLGNPAALLEAANKHSVLERARACGIRVPRSRPVSSQSEASRFAREIGFPMLLKRSFGWAGVGVAVCRDESELRALWKHWHRRAEWKRRFYAWRNSIRGRELGSRWLPPNRAVVASQFIAGKPAMSVATGFAGQMLAALTSIKEKCFPTEFGPSSVVRFISNPEMRQATGKLVAAWGLTGFIAFDFILDSSGDAWLIECNPRPTPIAHLGARLGEDICAALYCRLTGQPAPRLRSGVQLVVAHYPQESLRDPASPYLTGSFHDVPEDDPNLMRWLSTWGK